MATALKLVPTEDTPAQPAPKKRWLIATHDNPDTDALLCVSFARIHLVKEGDFELMLVRSGESVSPEDAANYDEVLVMDTGRGELDQHERGLKRSSSFVLFCEKYGFDKDEAMQPFLELSRATDNVEEVDTLSLHYLLKGLRFEFRDQASKKTDWAGVFDEACFLIGIHYRQIKSWIKSRSEFAKNGKVEELANGVKVSILERRARLREAAFEAGADVVFWTDQRKGGNYIGIQVNRRSDMTLSGVIEGIRVAEAQKRGVNCAGHKLSAPGKNDVFGAWFLHDSEKLILCGSLTHELDAEEFTKLPIENIIKIMNNRLLYRPNNNKKK